MQKVLYSDLDGTLFTYSKCGATISKKNLKAINNFTKNNHFGIATGRNIESVHKYFKGQIPVNINLPFVLMNGSCVYDLKKDYIVYQDIMKKNIVDETIEYIKGKELGYLLLITPTKRYHVGTFNEEKFGKLNYEINVVDQKELKYEEISKINIVIEEKYYEEIMNDIEKFKSFKDLDLIPASKRYIEIVNKGTSKEDGIIRALNYYSISEYKLYAVGDFTNDLSMLRNADVSFAPINASQDIKAVVDYIVSHHKDDAVANVIEIIEKSRLWEQLHNWQQKSRKNVILRV